MHPRYRAKLRGKKKKERARKEIKKRKMFAGDSNMHKLWRMSQADTPENRARQKHVKQWMHLISVYWHLRMRLLLKQTRPFFRERTSRRRKFSKGKNALYLAYYAARQHYKPQTDFLHSFDAD